MTRLLFLAAAVVLVGILSVPVLLSRRYSDSDRYRTELADWHVRWGASVSLEERRNLVVELGRIQPPLGAASEVSRHRRYVRAHELVQLSDEAAGSLVDQVRASMGTRDNATAFGCETLAEFSGDAERILQESGLRTEWVAQACEIRAVARSQLADLRADALLDWLREEIRDRPESATR